MNQVVVLNLLFRVCLVLALCSTACSRALAPEPQAVPSVARCTSDDTTPLASLAGCREVEGDVRVAGTSLRDLALLTGLRSISGALSIENNSRLVSLDGLEHLLSVSDLRLVDNPKLADVSGLSGLSRARRISVIGHPELRVFAGVDAVTALDALVIGDNGLTRLSGFNGVTFARHVVIRNNPRLIYLSGLSQLAFVEDLSIRDNSRLAPTAGLLRSLPGVDRRALAARGRAIVEQHTTERMGPPSSIHHWRQSTAANRMQTAE